ncbi:MAG: SIS domain-containing protein [Synergistaceae bacterium]|jgi:fructoselysine-6-P-deglycase FrlB-like protein|nr:SIS domain-containing protein [Synergistaceae bacterium]
MNGYLQEVLTQGKLLKKAVLFYRNEGRLSIDSIRDTFRKKQMDRVVLTGMGSSLYAIDCIRGYLTQHGIPAVSFSSHELSRYQFNHITPTTLVVAISQSGNSAEVIELVEKAKKITAVVGIFNNEDCKLQAMAEYKLPIRAEKEVSITSKTYEITMLILNVLARALTGELDDGFWTQAEMTAEWCCEWLENWREQSQAMCDFAQGLELFDLLANGASLATARQLSLAHREGLRNCAAVWECADYAHGQYHSSKMGERYLAQMFFPVFAGDTKEMKMFDFILNHGGKVMVYTASEIHGGDRIHVVKMPALPETLMPMAESVAAETMLGLLFGDGWVKDH